MIGAAGSATEACGRPTLGAADPTSALTPPVGEGLLEVPPAPGVEGAGEEGEEGALGASGVGVAGAGEADKEITVGVPLGHIGDPHWGKARVAAAALASRRSARRADPGHGTS